MNRVTPRATSFDSVKGKVVVLSGGATSVGAATVERLYRGQAHVVFGDTNENEAIRLINRLKSENGECAEVTFVKCNVTEYADVYKLFRTAYDKYGHVHHAFAIETNPEQGDWFSADLTIESVEHAEHTTEVLEVNLIGTAFFAQIAAVFLRNGMQRNENRSLTLTSSVAGIWECPGQYMHQVSTHGILGLMRSMRKIIYARDGIRVNCICPGTTRSLMSMSAVKTLNSKGYSQTSDDCARFYLGIANSPCMNGKSIYVEGGKGWEFEDGLRKTMPQWLGEEPTKLLREGMEATKAV